MARKNNIMLRLNNEELGELRAHAMDLGTTPGQLARQRVTRWHTPGWLHPHIDEIAERLELPPQDVIERAIVLLVAGLQLDASAITCALSRELGEATGPSLAILLTQMLADELDAVDEWREAAVVARPALDE